MRVGRARSKLEAVHRQFESAEHAFDDISLAVGDVIRPSSAAVLRSGSGSTCADRAFLRRGMLRHSAVSVEKCGRDHCGKTFFGSNSVGSASETVANMSMECWATDLRYRRPANMTMQANHPSCPATRGIAIALVPARLVQFSRSARLRACQMDPQGRLLAVGTGILADFRTSGPGRYSHAG
jgi:hypothetical protein